MKLEMKPKLPNGGQDRVVHKWVNTDELLKQVSLRTKAEAKHNPIDYQISCKNCKSFHFFSFRVYIDMHARQLIPIAGKVVLSLAVCRLHFTLNTQKSFNFSILD